MQRRINDIRVDEIIQEKYVEEDQCVIGSGRVELMKNQNKMVQNARNVRNKKEDCNENKAIGFQD